MITRQNVRYAVDALRNKGLTPTLRNIRAELGSGSLATIHKFLNEELESQTDNHICLMLSGYHPVEIFDIPLSDTPQPYQTDTARVYQVNDDTVPVYQGDTDKLYQIINDWKKRLKGRETKARWEKAAILLSEIEKAMTNC